VKRSTEKKKTYNHPLDHYYSYPN